MSTILRPVLFMNAVTASGTFPTTGPINIDASYNQDRLRSISGTRSDVNDAVHVLVETVIPQYASNGDVLTSIVVTATATTFTSTNGVFNSCVLQGPFTRIKIQKTGSSGAATFVGYV